MSWSMPVRQRAAFQQEMQQAIAAFHQQQWPRAFAHLQRAHILGQRYALAHSRSHWWMLRVAWRRRDWRELRGQLLRLPAALLLSRLWVPEGNSGGADVSPFRTMPVEPALRRLMEADHDQS